MTIRKRLARSNIAMLVIPLLTAAVLALLGLGAALLLLRGNLMTLHDAAEQIESLLHGFKLTLCVYAAVAALLLAAVALTNLYLTRSLFRHIAQPLDTLTAGVARIRDGDLDTPIAYGEPDEFKSACDAVDEMAARLKASLEQQAAQQQKQKLIAGMSHDLKSPPTAIRAYTEGLLEGVAQDEATRQRYLQTTYAKEADMETLVNRLFAFAKMDVSQYPVRLEPLALRTELEAVAEEQEDLAVTVDVPEITVQADRELLRRIAVNLLDNSRKYGGRADVHVRITAEETGGMAAVAFADNGAGVPPEQLSRLFDVFYRGDAARTTPGNGSGIGLAVVKRSAQEMGGTVRAENEAGGGLRVVVTLPLPLIDKGCPYQSTVAKEDRYGENTYH